MLGISFNSIKIGICCLLTFMWLFGCNREPEHLPMDQMTKILTEMYVAESYAQYIPKDTTRKEMRNEDSLKKFIVAVLHENKITETTFKQSIDWYKTKPALLDSIYQQVLTDLSIWQTKIDRK